MPETKKPEASFLEVIYRDGKREWLEIDPLTAYDAEREEGSEGRPLGVTLRAGWIASGRPGDFRDWMASIADFNQETKPIPLKNGSKQ